MGVAIMYKTGLYLMGVALALAFLGIFFSDPSGQMPDRLNLFRMALRGLEVQMIRLSADPPRYLVSVLARDWLLGCMVLALLGAALAIAGRARQRG
ncbi:MAG: hypothetical protein CL858_34115 [Cupriavidus sp.]|jgi:hypothetical protein|uniref:hypothetical protein n=1 Tax=Cupriavidus pauculus TaxID=82633 RepID=UPI0007851BA8|nr:hypothetical protein [Cupriavidus pauculus]MBU70401.1 hypothetical protein [Cupriavidus sp.]KAB0605176.1 hypothetical protein F7R19_01220 [Cupriavidus pauculus]MBY4729201.1 hypothetical protein [Cupriavidus pauculus]MCM3605079.1 hypothetical protein [Cupriavidus pauculus]UAK99534.1 hypothetical protein K8O84_16410 [Cupriavidus pauculus]